MTNYSLAWETVIQWYCASNSTSTIWVLIAVLWELRLCCWSSLLATSFLATRYSFLSLCRRRRRWVGAASILSRVLYRSDEWRDELYRDECSAPASAEARVPLAEAPRSYTGVVGVAGCSSLQKIGAFPAAFVGANPTCCARGQCPCNASSSPRICVRPCRVRTVLKRCFAVLLYPLAF